MVRSPSRTSTSKRSLRPSTTSRSVAAATQRLPSVAPATCLTDPSKPTVALPSGRWEPARIAALRSIMAIIPGVESTETPMVPPTSVSRRSSTTNSDSREMPGSIATAGHRTSALRSTTSWGHEQPRHRRPSPVRDDGHLPLPVPDRHDGARAVHRVAQDGLLPRARGSPLPAVAEERRGARPLRAGRALLGQDLRRQLRGGGGHRHPARVPVRHQLGEVLELRGRRHRADAGDGGCLRLLRRVRLPGHLPGRPPPGQRPRALDLGAGGVRGVLALGLLHHRHQRLDAAPGGLLGPRQGGEPQLVLGPPHQPVAPVAVLPQHERRGHQRRIRGGGDGRVLPALREAHRARSDLRAGGGDRRADLHRAPDLPDGRPRGARRRRAPAVQLRGDGGAVQDREGRAARDPRQPGHRETRARLVARDAELPVVPHVASLERATHGAERDPHEQLAGLRAARLLRVPHHGRPRHDPAGDRGARLLPALAPAPLHHALDAVGADARVPVHVHREHRGLGHGRGGTPAVGDLRPPAYEGSRVARQLGSRRHGHLHAARLRGPLPVRGDPLPGADPSNRQSGARGPGDAHHVDRRGGGSGLMHTAWFCFLALMITLYVVLDGFDLGVGAMHLILARTEEEREQATAAIGPVWNGNEVWLIAGGGVLFMTFPKAYAGAFSGLYFGLIIVLWLLVGRGLALELRHQLDNAMWRAACDAVFCLSSATLALVFGVALGNVVRGVPLDADGYFGLPLFHILNWYGLLIGAFGLATLCAHGSSFLAWRGTGALAERARLWARRLWLLEVLLFLALIGPTISVRDSMVTNLFDHPWTLIFPALAIGSLGATFVLQRSGDWTRAFGASALFIVGMLTTMAAGLYPDILPARDGHPFSLTIDNAAAGDHALRVGIVWWALGMVLAAVYFTYAYRMFFRSGPPELAAGD